MHLPKRGLTGALPRALTLLANVTELDMVRLPQAGLGGLWFGGLRVLHRRALVLLANVAELDMVRRGLGAGSWGLGAGVWVVWGFCVCVG